jgi:peptidoglycan/xylan/chitin deacetylase (PgdA/CDA1 family)
VDLTRWRNRDGFRILAYHRFWPPDDTVRTHWDAQLRHLRKHYVVRPIPQIVADLLERRQLAPNTLAITVDDGHRDFYTVAYPALKAHGLPATVFVTTGFLDHKAWLWFDEVVYAFRHARAAVFDADVPGAPPARFALDTPQHKCEAGAVVAEALQPLPAETRKAWTADLARRLNADVPPLPDAEYAALAWDEVREMAANGISFCAHTVTHPTLSSLPDGAAIFREMAESKRRVEEETHQEAPVFCYPNGRDRDVSPAIVQTAKDAGFRGAVMMEPGLNLPGTDLFRLRRMGVEPVLDPMYFARQCAVLHR